MGTLINIQPESGPDAPALSLREVQEKYRKYHNPTLVRLLKFAGFGALETRAEGVYVYDEADERYLDFAGGYGVFSLGHCHPRVVAAVQRQVARMPMSAKVFFNAEVACLAERLAHLSPGALQYSFFCNSGTEAVEGALKIARLSTGRSGFVSTWNSFHGKTMGALSVSGRDLYRTPFEPLVGDVVRVDYGDTAALDAAVDQQTAAVILEPIQGEGGIIVPPDGYLRAAPEICDRSGALLIADEVQTGLARTGRMFAVEHEDVVPDILVLGKALGGGVIPVGAFMGTADVWKAFHSNPLIHTSTFGGNPLACVAALTALDVLVEENLAARAAHMGQRLMEGLRGVQSRHPRVIREVRGRGLMVGVELTEERFGGAVILEMAHRRVIGVYTLNQPKVIRFEPPIIVLEEHVDQAIAAFEAAVSRAESMFKGDA